MGTESLLQVLVVDDSAIVRRVVTMALAHEPTLRVQTVANGQAALDHVARACPDVIILDIEMPGIDGLTVLRRLRSAGNRVPVIMFSSVSERNAAITLEALTAGADDYLAKPGKSSDLQASVGLLRLALTDRIRLLVRRLRPAPTAVRVAAARSQGRIDAIVIAASTGGPNALGRVLADLPPNLSVPIALVQHMPPLFTSMLTKTLARTSRLNVREATDGALLRPGEVWIAPGGRHLTIKGHGLLARLHLSDEAPEQSCRPAADPLFRSAAAAYGPHLLGVVLTGMGRDGTNGCQAVAAAGGQVIAQDEASSIVWGMPGSVAKAGLAHEVLPLDKIAAALIARATTGRSPTSKAGAR